MKEEFVLSERVDAAKKPAAPEAMIAPADKDSASGDLLGLILSTLDKEKAEDVVPIALKGKSEMADHMVVASGRSSRQVVSIAEKLNDVLKSATGRVCRMEGRETGDWVLLDCGDVIVHLFRPEVREFYQLEKMWLPTSETAATPKR